MISYYEAKKILLTNVYSLSSVKIFSLNSLDKICFENIYSRYNIPYLNNSAMDGYAIKILEIKLTSYEKPLIYKVVGCQFAGQNFYFNDIESYCVIEIMTGAILPNNFNAVIKKEDVEVIYINNVKYIIIKKLILAYENVRITGEDVFKYDLIIKKGKIINSSDIMLLINLGINYIYVYKNPKIVLICTGEELIGVKFSLMIGQIYNSTYAYLKSFFYRLGITLYYYGETVDNTKLFVRIIKKIEILDNPEIIISTGGVSKGKCDFIITTLNLLKAEILFNGVCIKPGKPIIFAKINDYVYFFGLPGNPISSVIGVRFFVYPLIRKFFCLPDEVGIQVKLGHSLNKKIGYTNFMKSILYEDNNEYFIDCMYEQESFKIYSFTKTFFWAFLKDDTYIYKKNDYIDVFSYEPYAWRNMLYDK
ncbi:MAG: molybdopterin molybdotransferase MoeA [Candidatus Azosocius agrarius]|nr:MAG: molybdopterin molybdotransferase MoeA [Gammaproteobacteria bacterium]